MHRNAEVMKPQTLLLVIAGFLFALGMIPASASAADLSTKTAQVVPPGGNGCPVVAASDFVSYIYDNTLNSFDFVISDASYVALVGSAGETGIPFNQMTRMGIDAQGKLKMHVDVEATRVGASLPITITLLSARPNQPVCLSVVSTTLAGIAQTHAASQKPAPVAAAAKPEQETPTRSEAIPSAGGVVATGSFVSSIGQALKGACATPLAAQRTWLILLLAYMLIVGIALWAEYPLSLPSMRTPERVAGIVLALLLALLCFWYFSATCRTALWMPLVAVLIAILGLLAAFRNHPRVTQLLVVRNITNIPS